MKITFCGAAQEVTGSMHVIEADGMKISLDCGLFQGRRSETESKNLSFLIPATDIHAVILSHAHIDHCGRLPLLSKQGFKGRIFATPATRDLCALMLADAAHIQEEDAKFLNKRRNNNGEHGLIRPLYAAADAARVMRLFQTVSDFQDFWPTKCVKAQFLPTGHMLGACLIALQYSAPAQSRPVSIVYSGDVGRFNLPILRDPSPFPPCDYLITESTYGARQHPPTTDLKGELADVVNETVSRGGRVIIPAFSVGRTQVIVYFLNQLRAEGRIPKIPVFVDSPLAIDATDVFRMHADLFDAEAELFQKQSGDILGAGCCTYVRDVEDSKKINSLQGPCIIISASGMCENGRILHHLKNNVDKPQNTVLIVGYQAAHTLGRRIVERQKEIKIFGQTHRLRAQVVILNGFSGHADGNELMNLFEPVAAGCKAAFLVHGEMDQMQPLRERMLKAGMKRVEMPTRGESFTLSEALAE